MLGPLQTFDRCKCCGAAFPEAVVRRVAQKFVRAMLRIWEAVAVRRASTRIGASSCVANRTTEPDPAAPKSATGIQSCATRRETMSAYSLDQL